MPPTVSVVIPTFNRANFIGDAIDSVLAQTVPVDEIIVVDDGSTDQTAAVLGRYARKVVHLRQRNAGPSAARNTGIENARGEFVAFQDSDDFWVPHKMERQLAFLAENPEIDVVFGLMADATDLNDALVPEIRNRELHHELQQNGGRIPDMFAVLLRDNVVPTPTVVVRRACFSRSGGFDPALRIAEDFDLWLRLSSVARFGFIDEILLKRRRHPGNLINDRITRLLSRISVLEQVPQRFPAKTASHRVLLTRQLSGLHYDLASLHLKRGAFRSAQRHLQACSSPSGRRTAYAIKRLMTAVLAPFDRSPVAAPTIANRHA